MYSGQWLGDEDFVCGGSQACVPPPVPRPRRPTPITGWWVAHKDTLKRQILKTKNAQIRAFDEYYFTFKICHLQNLDPSKFVAFKI